MMYLELFGGFIYLLLAGDLLVRGAVALARRAQISPMVIGITVVAFGTSAPELCVSVGAAFQGAPGIALGNVVGSNIANVLLVLGLPAIIYPTFCDHESLRRETLVVIAVSIAFALLCLRGSLGFVEGTAMFALMLALLARSALGGEPLAVEPEEEELERGLGLPSSRRMIAVFLALGGAGLPLGAFLIIEGAVAIASAAGVSNTAIGLTAVALGTSLPELGTTLIAAFHRHSDVAVGNVLGSNLFNILAIMGLTAMVAPVPISVPESFLRFDLVVMLGATAVLGYFARSGRIGRPAGAALLLSYGLYIAAVFSLPMMSATRAAALALP